MPSIQHFTIIFDKPQPVFTPGEQVTGRAILALNEPLEVDGVLLEFRGKAHVKWDEIRYSGWRDRLHTATYEAARHYVKVDLEVHGKGQLMPTGNFSDKKQGDADYVWPFNFQLPAEIPSSFEGRHGSIRYFVKSIVQKSAVLSINHRKKTFFNVVGLEDCNLPKYHIPLHIEDEKRTCFLWCAFDPIRMEVRVDRSAYMSLDKIAIFGDFDNRSTREVEPVARLVQTVTYQAPRNYAQVWENSFFFRPHTKVEQHTICEMRGKKIPPQSSDAWSPVLLQIPVAAPTVLSCDILTVQYHLKVFLDIPMAKDVKGLIPVTIGTIPYRGPAVGFGAAALAGSAFSGQYDSTAFHTTAVATPHRPSLTGYNASRNAIDAGKLPANNQVSPDYWELFPKPPEAEETLL